jgi:transposase
MEQSIRFVIGIDLGDRVSHACVLSKASGEIVERRRLATTRKGVRDLLDGRERSLVAIEVGTHSAWVSRAVTAFGHEVLVGDARRLAFIFKSNDKSDRSDAENLARVARVDPELLYPIQHRAESAQVDLAVLRVRNGLVEVRTKLINQVRGLVKSHGGRLRSCSATSFLSKAAPAIPDELRAAVSPLLDVLQEVGRKIRECDAKVRKLCEESYPETELLRQVVGVGPVTSLAYVLALGNPQRFQRSRDVGAFVGLTPRRDQSGGRDPQLRITKAGNPFLRRLLVQAAQYILGPFGPDSDLRRFGEAMMERGGANAKKRAVVAVARKLAVLLHALWKTGSVYEPVRIQEQAVLA